jgi:hypothetical protein
MPFCSSRYRYNACTGSNLYTAKVRPRNDILLRSMKLLNQVLKSLLSRWSRQCALYATLKPHLISSILSSVSDPACRHEKGQSVAVLVPTYR